MKAYATLLCNLITFKEVAEYPRKAALCREKLTLAPFQVFQSTVGAQGGHGSWNSPVFSDKSEATEPDIFGSGRIKWDQKWNCCINLKSLPRVAHFHQVDLMLKAL